jgi:hypothetical protein
MKISCAHASMQHTDGWIQQWRDARTLFRRAKARGHLWVTGTERNRHLAGQARKNGYQFMTYSDTWLAVRTKEKLSYNRVLVIRGQTGKWMPRGILWTTFAVPRIGTITVGVSHYVPGGRVNSPLNRKLAARIGRWAEYRGRGDNLVFYGGDQNRDDRVSDTFFGLADLTTVWDELGKYEPTGGKGGTLDVIASYNRDGRVRAVSVNALSDRELFLYSDHRLVEATFNIKEL